ncbi:MAG: DnaJ domain-containing protein [Oscillospiraceae bacterium]|jgi:GGDEF domain-containing protein|nr:DnaJ domain-containing protein [Oscillospiraceae bacterium]
MDYIIDSYKILGVRNGADLQDIVTSYRRLCRKYHPDLNPAPDSEERMKQINIAYEYLCSELRREAGRRVVEADSARGVIQGYFAALLRGDTREAYTFLSDYDKRYVTYDSFREWRHSVSRIFLMRDFTVREEEASAFVTVRAGARLTAKRFTVHITERNLVDRALSKADAVKYAVLEEREWHVFLGYADLAKIAENFRIMFEESRRNGMGGASDEQTAAQTISSSLGVLDMDGLSRESSRELYRHKRYGGDVALAAIHVGPRRAANRDVKEEMLRSAARVITDNLRETDIPAYYGDGVFVIVYTELKSRFAPTVIRRLADKIRTEVESRLRTPAEVTQSFRMYGGGKLADEVESITRKFAAHN